MLCRKQGPFHSPFLPAPSCSTCFGAWESASPRSDDMEKCVLNQAQTCLLRWKHSTMIMTNPSSQLVQIHASPGFPESAQRGYVWKISQKLTLEACRGIFGRSANNLVHISPLAYSFPYQQPDVQCTAQRLVSDSVFLAYRSCCLFVLW